MGYYLDRITIFKKDQLAVDLIGGVFVFYHCRDKIEITLLGYLDVGLEGVSVVTHSVDLVDLVDCVVVRSI